MSFDGKETKQNVLRSFHRSGKKFTREAHATVQYFCLLLISNGGNIFGKSHLLHTLFLLQDLVTLFVLIVRYLKSLSPKFFGATCQEVSLETSQVCPLYKNN